MRPTTSCPFHRKRISSHICSTRAAHSAESTDKCKNRQSFWSTRLLMIQTFVFVRPRGSFSAVPPPSFEGHPAVAVRRQRSEIPLIENATAANRRHSLNARASRASGGFRFFAFTSSPHRCISLKTSVLRVKASPFTENPLSSSSSTT